jgi:hypothetical protein
MTDFERDNDNVTFVRAVKMDDFSGLLENRASKIFSIILSLLTIPVIIAMFYGIVWYERFGSDNKRTLMNKLIAALCWSFIQVFGVTIYERFLIALIVV